jgi:hypothetical protein
MKATAAPKKKKTAAATKALRNKDGQKRTVVQHKNGTMQVVHWLDNAVSDIVGPALYHKIQTTVLNNQRTTNGTVTKTKRLLGLALAYRHQQRRTQHDGHYSTQGSPGTRAHDNTTVMFSLLMFVEFLPMFD